MSFRLEPSHEAVYSEALCQPEDIFYYGSDDEYYESSDQRRERYEAAAQRFLAGEQRSILSSTLRGPFERSQGWLNPWRSRKLASRSEIPPQSTTGGIKRRSKQDVPADTQDSFESHLPSPESLKKVEIEPHPFLEDADVDRVQKWQRTVKHSEDDDELASTPSHRHGSTTQGKRRAKSSDWLRQSSNKKRRMEGLDAGSVGTPTRQSRKDLRLQPSPRPTSFFKTSFQSSHLCHDNESDNDELSGAVELAQASDLYLASSQRRPAFAKRSSPKRAIRQMHGSDSTESADELSQETTKDAQAAATLSSPVSNKDMPRACPPNTSNSLPPTAKASAGPLPMNTGSPIKKRNMNRKKKLAASRPVTAAPPAQKLRTPRMRKSRMKHKIEALRAPLPRLENRLDAKSGEANEEVIVAKDAPDAERASTPTRKSQENTLELGSSVFRTRESLHLHDEPARFSSPLSDISSSYGSVSWQGLSSPASAEPRAKTDATPAPLLELSSAEQERGGEKAGDHFLQTSKRASGTDQQDTSESEREDDGESDTFSQLSYLELRDMCLRSSSVMRMDELPPFEKSRLDAELDSESEDDFLSTPEDPVTDNDASGYETARSGRSESCQATPAAGKATDLVEDTQEVAPIDDTTAEATNYCDVPGALTKETSKSRESLIESSGFSEVATGVAEQNTPVTSPTTNVRATDDAEIVRLSGIREPDETDPVPHGEVISPSFTNPDITDVGAPTDKTKTNSTEATVDDKIALNAPIEAQTLLTSGDNEEAVNGSADGRDAAAIQDVTLPQPSFDSVVLSQALESLPVADGVLISPRPSTPEHAFRPFAAFISPSPEHKARQRHRAKMRDSLRRISGMERGSTSSILKHPWTQPKPTKSVSWAGLPSVEEPYEFIGELDRPEKERPTSPPPNAPVEDLPTSSEAGFSTHFNAMARRAGRSTTQRISPVCPDSSQGNHDISAPPATHVVGESREGPDSAASPKNSFFGAFDCENQPPASKEDDLDDVFDEMSAMLKPYDLDAELEDAREGTSGINFMEGINFGGW